ncbi:transmembrane protein 223-like [Homarus americanus]|uniref:Transmembrane protein 223-like n=1 Tax=Homarus americanus TaxID=6706 RepID=A0A8J5JYM4_HOMAM|nr:transmembrane protein 223-like [Homarus americanus]KAG7164009.1 Transmembrane protein 223-like [Homarus americanus]
MTVSRFILIAKECRVRCNLLYRTSLCEAAVKQWRTPCRSQHRQPPPSYHRSPTSRNNSRLILEHEYAVPKDTILFRYENSRFFKLMNMFAISQFFFWLYLSHFAFTTMRNVPVRTEEGDKTLPWWRRINFGEYKNGIAIGSFFIGWGTMAICWMYTLRSVKYLILKKGGKDLVFLTFAPFGHHRSMTVPLEKVSAKQSRFSAKVTLPLKVQGSYFHYILDMSGEFTNAKLFDYSAGLQRNWSKK